MKKRTLKPWLKCIIYAILSMLVGLLAIKLITMPQRVAITCDKFTGCIKD